jgi:FkbM family methyltransferase
MNHLHDIPDNWQHADIEEVLLKCFPPLHPFKTALDVGAHRGVVTEKLLQYFHRVVAVEPGPLARQISPEAVVINCALGAASGSVAMTHGKHNTGQHHVIAPGEVVELPLGVVPEVYECRRMDDLDRWQLDGLEFIKIDVEGLEYAVLAGGEQTIKTHRPVIMFEVNGLSRRYGYDPEDAGRLLESWGYRRKLKLRSNAPDEDWVYVPC